MVTRDMNQTDTHYLMTFDIPGIDVDDIQIEILDNQLSISSKRSSQQTSKETRKTGRTVTRKRRSALFRHAITLPVDTDPDRIEACFRKGVLEITIPKK
jgi:HSP20 family protein